MPERKTNPKRNAAPEVSFFIKTSRIVFFGKGLGIRRSGFTRLTPHLSPLTNRWLTLQVANMQINIFIVVTELLSQLSDPATVNQFFQWPIVAEILRTVDKVLGHGSRQREFLQDRLYSPIRDAGNWFEQVGVSINRLLG